MGFPRLTQDLAAYAEYLQVGHGSEESHTGSSLVEQWVIDGPSIAYHAYNNLVANEISMAASTRSALPTYNEVNHAVRAYLTTLEEHGINIEAIFFDGSLPATKRPVRLERLEKTREQLQSFRQQGLGQSTRLPPLPLLVASAIESLQTSRWADRVRVVPEEADVACARMASVDVPISILTNDSDLALFRMHAETRVVWLHSLVKKIQKDGSTFLQASVLLPSATATRLKLPSLLPFGFERQRDPSVPTGTILGRARYTSRHGAESDEYAKFCKPYLVTSNTAHPAELGGCDPRVAEYLLQVNSTEQAAQVYLPLLHEDPSRDASWTYGFDVRQLAYSIFRHSYPGASPEVTEHYRKGNRIAPSSVQLMSAANTLSAVAVLLATLNSTLRVDFGKDDLIHTVIAWWGLALSMFTKIKVARGNTVDVTTVRILFGLEKAPAETGSWDTMHLLANMHAVLYSLRMLKQILAFTQRNCDQLVPEAPELTQLATILQRMPSIEVLFLDLRQMQMLVAETGLDKAKTLLGPVEAIEKSAGAECHLDDQQEATSKAKRRKAKYSRSRDGSRNTQNTFGILADANEDIELNS